MTWFEKIKRKKGKKNTIGTSANNENKIFCLIKEMQNVYSQISLCFPELISEFLRVFIASF